MSLQVCSHIVFQTISLLLIVTVAVAEFPTKLQHCALGDEACFTQQAQTYLREYQHGIPQSGVPTLEPLEVGSLRVQIGSERDPMQLSLVLKDAAIYNFGGSITIESLKIDADPKDHSRPVKAIMKLSSPALDVEGDYNVKGKFLILPINSSGRIGAKLKGVDVGVRIKLQPQKSETDEFTYLKITEYKMSEQFKGVYINMTNLFKDNEELNASTLKVFNDEWRVFEKTMRPKIMDAIKRGTQAAVQKLLDLMPYETLFAPDA